MSEHSKLTSVILAAGKGTRMKSDLPKVLHPVCGRPMLQYVIETAHQIGSDKIIVVVGHQANLVQQTIRELNYDFPVDFVVQEPQLGTGHAVQQAESLLIQANYLRPQDEVLVLSGDVPLIQAETLNRLLETYRANSTIAGAILTAQASDPTGFGRIVHQLEDSTLLAEIVEEKDITTPTIREIREINTGTYVFQADLLFQTLPKVKCENRQKEYYLPDVVKIWAGEGRRLATQEADFSETQGVNTREHLSQVGQVLISREH